MVIPVGLPDDQTLVVADKDMNGRVKDEGNYAGLVLVARGTRRACIPRILTTMGADIPDDEVARSLSGAQRRRRLMAESSPLQVRVCRPDIFRTLS